MTKLSDYIDKVFRAMQGLHHIDRYDLYHIHSFLCSLQSKVEPEEADRRGREEIKLAIQDAKSWYEKRADEAAAQFQKDFQELWDAEHEAIMKKTDRVLEELKRERRERGYRLGDNEADAIMKRNVRILEELEWETGEKTRQRMWKEVGAGLWYYHSNAGRMSGAGAMAKAFQGLMETLAGVCKKADDAKEEFFQKYPFTYDKVFWDNINRQNYKILLVNMNHGTSVKMFGFVVHRIHNDYFVYHKESQIARFPYGCINEAITGLQESSKKYKDV